MKCCRFFCLIASVAVLGGVAHGITIDDAVAPPVALNGTSSWLGVGYIIDAPSALGSGVLIDRQHVLTAAHVVYLQQPQNVSFHLTGLGEPAAPFAVSSIAINPTYTPSTLYGDIAVITLAQPVPEGTMTYAYNAGQIADETDPNLSAQIVGFGKTGNGTNGATIAAPIDPAIKHAATNIVDRVGKDGMPAGGWSDGYGNHFIPPDDTLLFDFDKVNGLTPAGWASGAGLANWSGLTNAHAAAGANAAFGALEGDTAAGDSGGPMFQFDPISGTYIVTGLTSSGTDLFSRYGDIAFDTRVQSFASFIASAVPEPATVSWLAAAAMVLAIRRPSGHSKPCSAATMRGR